jgi:hypothetical protein
METSLGMRIEVGKVSDSLIIFVLRADEARVLKVVDIGWEEVVCWLLVFGRVFFSPCDSVAVVCVYMQLVDKQA